MPARCLALALALLAAPAAARAHDLWVDGRGGALAIRFGHRGEDLPLDAARVTAVRCLDASGSRDVRRDAEAARGVLEVRAACDVLSATFDGGYWTRTPDGERNLPRTQVKGAVRSWASRQFAKWIDPRSPRAATPMGDELEIVPVSDLSRAKHGDKVTVRVLVRGAPARGARVAVGHKTIGETDGAGEVRVRIRADDVETIGTSIRTPLEIPEAESLLLEATLSFRVAR